jgi:hypothetical protein
MVVIVPPGVLSLPRLDYDHPSLRQNRGQEMAAPRFKVTKIDGSVEEIRLRPRAQIDYEDETGEALINLDSEDMKVSKLYTVAWYAAGKPDTFDEWIDSLDAVEMADEDADKEGDDTTRPT